MEIKTRPLSFALGAEIVDFSITSSLSTQPVQPKKVKSLLDDDEDTQPTQPQVINKPLIV